MRTSSFIHFNFVRLIESRCSSHKFVWLKGRSEGVTGLAKACEHLITSSASRKLALTSIAAQRVVVPIVSVEALENTDRVIDDLRASRVTGRKVIVPSL